MTTYNQDELRKAEEAFPNLAELRQESPKGRLAMKNSSGLYLFIVGNKDKEGTILCTSYEGYNGYMNEKDITYLEPPREPQPMFTEEEREKLTAYQKFINDEFEGRAWDSDPIDLVHYYFENFTPQQTEQETDHEGKPMTYWGGKQTEQEEAKGDPVNNDNKVYDSYNKSYIEVTPTKEQLLAKVPMFTEEELKQIRDDVRWQYSVVSSNGQNYLRGKILAKLIPQKQPWGQLEHLKQLAKWGKLKGVQIKYDNMWQNITGISDNHYAFFNVTTDEFRHAPFSDITHIRAKDGEEIECVKEVEG